MDDAEIGACVRRLITAWLDWHTGVDRRERAAELVDRVEGYRIVDGGQIDRDGTWEITDAETGELLARGTGLKSFDEAWLFKVASSWSAPEILCNVPSNFGRTPPKYNTSETCS